MRFVSLAAALVLGCFVLAESAAASTITTIVDFTASDFTSSSGSVPAPISPVTGSFTLTFDPDLDYSEESAGIALNNININVSGVPLFSHFAGIYNGVTIGMSPGGGANSAQWGTNDFFLAFNIDGSHYPKSVLFGYTQGGVNNFFTTYNVALTLTPPVVAATPIPGSVLLLLTALTAIGSVAFVRHRKVERFPAFAAA
jgi:hypothetical protein